MIMYSGKRNNSPPHTPRPPGFSFSKFCLIYLRSPVIFYNTHFIPERPWRGPYSLRRSLAAAVLPARASGHPAGCAVRPLCVGAAPCWESEHSKSLFSCTVQVSGLDAFAFRHRSYCSICGLQRSLTALTGELRARCASNGGRLGVGRRLWRALLCGAGTQQLLQLVARGVPAARVGVYTVDVCTELGGAVPLNCCERGLHSLGGPSGLSPRREGDKRESLLSSSSLSSTPISLSFVPTCTPRGFGEHAGGGIGRGRGKFCFFYYSGIF